MDYSILTSEEYLYFDALSEIAEQLGNSFEYPISVTLLCLQLEITNKEKEKIVFAFQQVLQDNSFDKLDVEKFRVALECINPRFGEFANKVIIGLIKGFFTGLHNGTAPFCNYTVVEINLDRMCLNNKIMFW